MYFYGIINEGIYYKRVKDSTLIGYCDWGGSVDDCRSTSSYSFHIGSGAISWASKKQSVVALSITEAEYIALALASCQVLWIRWILSELKHEQVEGTTCFVIIVQLFLLQRILFFMGKANI